MGSLRFQLWALVGAFALALLLLRAGIIVPGLVPFSLTK